MTQRQSEEFVRRLQRAIEGEVFGEELFTRLASQADDVHHRSALERLALLEHLMWSALVHLAEREKIAVPDGTGAVERANTAAASLADQSWESFVEAFEDGTGDALRGYDKLRAASTAPDDDTLLLLVAHEEALQKFARSEMEGGNDPLASVNGVVRQLQSAVPTHRDR
jgi:hypothetical protein